MVRATAASLAATSNADANTSPTPASRVAELGEHIDATLRIHEPDPNTAEKFAIAFADTSMPKAFVFVRPILQTLEDPNRFESAIFFNGEFVDSDTFSTRRAAFLGAQGLLFKFVSRQRHTSEVMRAAARELNEGIKRQLDDATETIPAGEPCEWPIAVDDEEQAFAELTDPPTDDTTDDSDINEDGDVECEAVGATAIEAVGATTELSEAADAAGGACGEGGVVGLREVDAVELLAIEKAQGLFYRALADAKDRYVEASQHRVGLQADVKEAKKDEADRLKEIDSIENRGWRYFLPSKKPAATTTATTATAPAFPSHDPLPPPAAEHNPTSPQAGEPEANHEAAAATAPARDWRSVSIDELGLPPSLTEKLKENGCPTIGKLEALRGSFDGLKSIRGIGKAKIDTIEDAVLAWLSKNRDSAALTAAKEAAIAGEAVGLEMAAQAQ